MPHAVQQPLAMPACGAAAGHGLCVGMWSGEWQPKAPTASLPARLRLPSLTRPVPKHPGLRACRERHPRNPAGRSTCLPAVWHPCNPAGSSTWGSGCMAHPGRFPPTRPASARPPPGPAPPKCARVSGAAACGVRCRASPPRGVPALKYLRWPGRQDGFPLVTPVLALSVHCNSSHCCCWLRLPCTAAGQAGYVGWAEVRSLINAGAWVRAGQRTGGAAGKCISRVVHQLPCCLPCAPRAPSLPGCAAPNSHLQLTYFPPAIGCPGAHSGCCFHGCQELVHRVWQHVDWLRRAIHHSGAARPRRPCMAMRFAWQPAQCVAVAAAACAGISPAVAGAAAWMQCTACPGCLGDWFDPSICLADED